MSCRKHLYRMLTWRQAGRFWKGAMFLSLSGTAKRREVEEEREISSSGRVISIFRYFGFMRRTCIRKWGNRYQWKRNRAASQRRISNFFTAIGRDSVARAPLGFLPARAGRK